MDQPLVRTVKQPREILSPNLAVRLNANITTRAANAPQVAPNLLNA